MKLISEHLGEIIVVLAGVALLISAVVFFKADISEFFDNIVATLTEKGQSMLDSIETPKAELGA